MYHELFVHCLYMYMYIMYMYHMMYMYCSRAAACLLLPEANNKASSQVKQNTR